jgi:hypothetical protein
MILMCGYCRRECGTPPVQRIAEIRCPWCQEYLIIEHREGYVWIHPAYDRQPTWSHARSSVAGSR